MFDDIKSYGIKSSSDKTCIYLKALWNCGVHFVDMKVPCNQDFCRIYVDDTFKREMWRKKDEFSKSFYESNFSNRDSLKLLSLSDPKYVKSISTLTFNFHCHWQLKTFLTLSNRAGQWSCLNSYNDKSSTNFSNSLTIQSGIRYKV